MMRETRSESIAAEELRFEFEDASIHVDLYEIIEYWSEVISNNDEDHAARVMRMWETFLGPMMGISLLGEVEEEEVSEQKVKRSPRRGAEEDATVKLGVENEVNGQSVGEHDHDGDSDNASEAGLFSASDEQSGDEQSEHEAKDEEGQDDFVDGSIPKKAGRVFYGNVMFYVLFRLHRTLYERILFAKVSAELEAKKKGSDAGDLFWQFNNALLGLLDGTVGNSEFEDICRALFGTQADVLFTLDKLIFKLVKQLQAAVTDHVALQLMALQTYQKASGAVESEYHANACVLLHNKRIYRFEYKSKELLIQVTDGGPAVRQEVRESSFLSYLDDLLLSSKNQRVFMMRCKKRNYAGRNEDEALQRAMQNSIVQHECDLKNRFIHRIKVPHVLALFWRCTVRRGCEQKERREVKKQRAFAEWLQNRNLG